MSRTSGACPWRSTNVFWLALLLVVPSACSAADLKFETVFSPRGEPASLHYTAVFSGHGADHQVQVWRNGDRQVRRTTDRAVDSYAWHTPGSSSDFDMSIADLRKRLITRVDRTSLYHIGNFTDWFDLTHGLRHPRGSYRLVAGHAPASAGHPLRPCKWYDLTEDSRMTSICWSAADRLPLLISSATGQVIWRILAVDQTAIPPAVFQFNDRGFVHVDARQDIEKE